MKWMKKPLSVCSLVVTGRGAPPPAPKQKKKQKERIRATHPRVAGSLQKSSSSFTVKGMMGGEREYALSSCAASGVLEDLDIGDLIRRGCFFVELCAFGGRGGGCSLKGRFVCLNGLKSFWYFPVYKYKYKG